ncbi:hypothetical protein [Cytobacillus sp. FSL K6-0265]
MRNYQRQMHYEQIIYAQFFTVIAMIYGKMVSTHCYLFNTEELGRQ